MKKTKEPLIEFNNVQFLWNGKWDINAHIPSCNFDCQFIDPDLNLTDSIPEDVVNNPTFSTLMLEAVKPGALVNPIGYNKKLDLPDLTIWELIPPLGYTCLGYIATPVKST